MTTCNVKRVILINPQIILNQLFSNQQVTALKILFSGVGGDQSSAKSENWTHAEREPQMNTNANVALCIQSV